MTKPKYKDQELLKNFMREMFDFDELVKCGFFKEEMRNDYQAQADKVCHFFGCNTIYEYGAKSARVHLTIADPNCPAGIKTINNGDFITEIPSIYD